MKIFVIGATGYVGGHVAACLLRGGHEVVGFARDDAGARKISAYGAQPVIGNLADASVVHQEALRADATIFAPQLPQDEEYATVERLLQAYRDTGKAFVFTSGTAVFGQRTLGEWSEDTFSEDDEFICSKYLQRRRLTEIMVRAAAQDGIRAMVIRPPAIWGDGVNALVSNIATSIRKTGAACYIGRGLNLYTHVHVSDLADLYCRAVESGSAGALYHAAGGELNNRTLAEYVARVAGVGTRSISMTEAFGIWDKFTVLVVQGVCSRSRCPRSRLELKWRPQRTDLAREILDGAVILLADPVQGDAFVGAQGRIDLAPGSDQLSANDVVNPAVE